MSDRSAIPAAGRIGIIDLGSNSLRLAVFERQGAALFPLLNEKVMCGLARGLASSGRLDRDGVALALLNLRRFVALARAIGVDHLAVLATAAVRDASDGQAFADEVARQCRVPVAVIDGAEEARLSAAGVLAGIPEAEGIVGDLGGGSVELVRVGSGIPGASAESGRIGEGITLPLGPLRLAELGGGARAVCEAVERALATAAVSHAGVGRNLYLVGGRVARDRPPAHGAHALPAPHRPPLRDRPRRGRGLFRHHRAAVAQIARADHDDLAQAPRDGAAGGPDPAPS